MRIRTVFEAVAENIRSHDTKKLCLDSLCEPRHFPIPFSSEVLRFLRKSDSYLHSMNKSVSFMIPAEGADGIDNPVHLPQGDSVQQFILESFSRNLTDSVL